MKIDGAHLQARLRYWRDILGIDSRWKFHVHLVDGSANMPEDCGDAIASIAVSPYFSADLHLNPWRIQSDEELDETLVHELLHVILRPYELTAEALHEDTPRLAEWLGEHTIEQLVTGYMRLHREAQKRRRR